MQCNRPQRAIAPPRNVKAASTSELSSNRKKNKPSQSRLKIRGPTLAQIVIQDSSKPPQIAMVRPGERKKKVRSPTGSTSSKARQDSGPSSPPPAYAVPQQNIRPGMDSAKTASDLRKPGCKQSTPNVASGRRAPPDHEKALRASKSTPRLQVTTPFVPFESLPPMPPIPDTAPLASAVAPPLSAAASTPVLVPRRRKPTPTYYSIATDSTKLGEIPLHKWTQPYDFDRMELLNREAYRNGWPNEPGNDLEGRKRRVGFWGLFRRRTD